MPKAIPRKKVLPLAVQTPVLSPTLPASRDALWRTALLIAAAAALGGVLGAVTANKQTFLYKDTLHLSASGVGTLLLLINLPAYLQPFMGGLSDLYPLGGWHRRSYFALAAVVQAAGYWGLMTLHAYHYAALVCLLIVAGTGAAMAGVLINAAMVSVGNRTGRFGVLQALFQVTPLLLSLAYTARLDGEVTQSWSYHHTFLVAALLSLAFLPLTFLLEDRRVTGRGRTAAERGEQEAAKQRERARTASALREAAATPGMWVMTAFLFYLYVTPLLLTASVYYETDVLHLSKGFIGRLDSWTAAGSIAGLAAFGAFSRKLPLRAVVWGAIGADAAIYLIAMTMHDAPSVKVRAVRVELPLDLPRRLPEHPGRPRLPAPDRGDGLRADAGRPEPQHRPVRQVRQRALRLVRPRARSLHRARLVQRPLVRLRVHAARRLLRPIPPCLGQKRGGAKKYRRRWELKSSKHGIVEYHIQKEVSTIGS